MKSKVFLFSMLAVLFAACEGKFEGTSKSTSDKVETVSATNIKSFSALLTGHLNIKTTDYKSIEYGILISDNDSDVVYYVGMMLAGDTLINQTFSVIANALSAETQYYYRAYVVLDTTQYEYGSVKSFKTEKDHPYVDLGLPSGLKWATYNVGATKPEEYGDYFAWGETSPKTIYDWDTYKWCNGSSVKLTKYCIHSEFGYNGFIDHKTTLDPEDDAAYVHWGGHWRLPTKIEFDELRNTEHCTWTWTNNYDSTGIAGYIVSSKKNSNSVFLPAAGYRFSTELRVVGSRGGYWSAWINGHISDEAGGIFFFGSEEVRWDHGSRYCGRSVRPVFK